MKRNLSRCAALIALATAPIAVADFEITSFTIDGGGGPSLSATFQLHGTIGQPDAGDHAQPMTGATLSLVGGFWQTGAPLPCEDCVGDLDGDGSIALPDLATLLIQFGLSGPIPCEQGDIEPRGGDDDVDIADLATLLPNFGTACE